MKYAILIVILALSLETSVSAQETIHIAAGEWPPYVSSKSKHKGIFSHIVTKAFGLEDVKVDIEFMPWPRILQQVRYGEKDGGIAWFYTPERAKYALYSDPVVYGRYVFFHLKSFHFDWQSVDDLAGTTIGLILDSYYGEELELAEKAGKIKVEYVHDIALNYQKILAGHIQLTVEDVTVGYDIIRNSFSPEEIQLFTHHPKPIITKSLHLILSKRIERNKRMLSSFNKGLKKLKLSGKYDKFFEEFRRIDYSIQK